MGHPLSEGGVEAGPPLLDKPKMETRRVGDRLEVIRDGWGSPRFKALQVIIGSRNRRKLPLTQTRDGLSERVPEIGVLRAAAVARPPAGVHRELHEVGEPSLVLECACRLTALQRAKLIQIDGIGALRNQVRIDEREVADLILGIVVYILGHVPIQHFKGSYVSWIPALSLYLAVLGSS